MSSYRTSKSVLAGLLGICRGALFLGAPAYCQMGPLKIATSTLYRDAASLHSAFNIDTQLILVPVMVTDAMDYPVTDLTKDSFRIFDDNTEHDVLSLHKEEGPASVGFIVDTSESMTDRLMASISAVEQFLETSTPGDEYFLVSFAKRVNLVTSFTGRAEEISAALAGLRAGGPTALNDAIYLGVNVMKHAKNSRRALIVLTDGGDNFSRYSASEVRSLVRESDLRVYSIGLLVQPRLLRQLTLESGGSLLWTRSMSDLPNVIDKLSAELRNEYMLGYSPDSCARDGKYHRIRVQLAPTHQKVGVHLSWRRGYYAPGSDTRESRSRPRAPAD